MAMSGCLEGEGVGRVIRNDRVGFEVTRGKEDRKG